MAGGPDVDHAPLAILCGGGRFPFAVADEVVRSGRPVFLIGLQGCSSNEIARYPHSWIRMGAFGRLVAEAKGVGARDILFVGGLTRPGSWRDVRPDGRLLLLLPRLIRALRGGDDRLLSALALTMEEAGLRVRGVQDVAPGLMIPRGPLGVTTPHALDEEDAAIGLRVLAALSPHDVGQGVVVAGGRVVAIEAAEGTDLMLERVTALRASGRLRLGGKSGVFVKAPKTGQDRRMDTPAVGPGTLARVEAAGLRGIAVAAGEVMAVDSAAMVEHADRSGLFITGLDGLPS